MSRRTSCVVLSLVAAALVAYYFWTTPGLFGSKAQGDGMFSFHYLPSVVVHHSLDMRHALPELLDIMDSGPHGHKLNRAPIGPALAMLPIYCLGETAKLVAVQVLRGLHRDPLVLGPPPFVPHTGQMLYTGLVTLAAGLFGMLLTYRLLRRYFPRGAALAGAGAAIVLTPQLWYLTIQPHYQHGLAFAAVALFLGRWDRERGSLRPRRFFGLGVLGGVAMLMRAQEAVFLLAPALELALALVRRREPPGRRTGAIGLDAAQGRHAGPLGLDAAPGRHAGPLGLDAAPGRHAGPLGLDAAPGRHDGPLGLDAAPGRHAGPLGLDAAPGRHDGPLGLDAAPGRHAGPLGLDAAPGRHAGPLGLDAAPERHAGRIGLCGALLGLGALLGFLPQLAVWGAYFGWFVRPTNIEPLRPLQPALAEVLWSMRAGLFPWTPVAYLGCAGLGLGLLRPGDLAAPAGHQPAGQPPQAGQHPSQRPGRRGLLAVAAIILLADVYLVASSWVWYGGFSFGARRLADCAGLLGIGVAELWAKVASGLGWRRLARAALRLGLCLLAGLNLTLVELVRQRRIPDSGAAAWPAYRLAQQAGGPAWLVALLRHGYPFAQPAGLLFALRHHAPLTAWEGVVGNYALEQEAHDRTLSGATWDFTGPQAELFVVEGLAAEPADERGRLIGPRVRVLLQPFTEGAIEVALEGSTEGLAGSTTGRSTGGSTGGATEGATEGSTGSTSASLSAGKLAPAGLVVLWNGQTLPTRQQGSRTLFTLPAAHVRAHAVGELVLLRPPAAPPARLRRLQLTAATQPSSRNLTPTAEPGKVPTLRVGRPSQATPATPPGGSR